LNAEYLKTLKTGKHTLIVASKTGNATTSFTIAHEHVLNKVEAKKATCTEKGNIEYYACVCGKWFEDEKAEKEITDKTSVEINAGHKPEKVKAKDATCTEKGNKEYFTCECGKWFEDEKATKEITNKSSVEIKAKGHTEAKDWTKNSKYHWHKCTVCGEIADEKEAHKFDEKTGKICEVCKYDVDKPQTGDDFSVGMIATMMVMSIMGVAAIVGYNIYDKKRKA
jgi:hypothetical protein